MEYHKKKYQAIIISKDNRLLKKKINKSYQLKFMINIDNCLIGLIPKIIFINFNHMKDINKQRKVKINKIMNLKWFQIVVMQMNKKKTKYMVF